jgi:uncharacterized membrane protein (UPF0127 family)
VPAPEFLRAALETPVDRLAITHEPSGRVIANPVELALDSASRRRGLLGRTRFEKGSALIIAPSSAVHTFFMAFPIDIVFLDRQGRIVNISRSVPARRIRLALRAYAVVEVPSGALRDAPLQPGDRLRIAAL